MHTFRQARFLKTFPLWEKGWAISVETELYETENLWKSEFQAQTGPLFASATAFELVSLLNSYIHVPTKKIKDPALTLQKLVPYYTTQQRNEIFAL